MATWIHSIVYPINLQNRCLSLCNRLNRVRKAGKQFSKKKFVNVPKEFDAYMGLTRLSINVIKMRKCPNLSYHKAKISNWTKSTLKNNNNESKIKKKKKAEENLKDLGIRMHEEAREVVAVLRIELSVQFEYASLPWTTSLDSKEHFELHQSFNPKFQRSRDWKKQRDTLAWV